MPQFKSVMILIATAALAWFASSFAGNARAQSSFGSPVRLVGLGTTNAPLPTDSNLRPYLPTQPDDRQLSFDAETWQKTGEVMSLLLDNTLLPRQVTICGRRLSIIQGGMRTSTTDESTYFPVTVNATGLTMPNEGCYSITPVAYLRIKGITTMPRTQLTTAVVTARY